MPQNIQIRRGTKAELKTRGALLPAEMGFCTDTKEVFIGDGKENIFIGRALSGDYSNRPNAGVNGRFYYVIEGSNMGYLYIDDGTAWHRVNAQALTDLTGNIDNISDGTTYAKVKKTEITNGYVNKLSDGNLNVTVEAINNHINDETKHRKINDSGLSNVDLWSAQKIKNEIELAKHNIEPQASVKDKELTAPPQTATLGDRYIIAPGAAGAWNSKANQIAEWNGTTWDYYNPSVGWSCYVDDEQKLYSWNGSSWVRTGGALQTIIAGKGLTGGGQADNVTLNVGQGDGIIVSEDAMSVKAFNGIKVDGNGVAVNIDNISIQYDSSNGNRLMVSNIDGGTF